MRIAISGTHFMGKTTLINDFIKRHPEYIYENEPYDILQGEQAQQPSLDYILEQLDYSIKQLHDFSNEPNIIFDRCPVDFIAYAMFITDQDFININDSEISERFSQIKEALDHLDLIAFLPMTKEYVIDYDEEDANYRKASDKNFKKLYRDEICDIFPSYNHPRIIEIWGDPSSRIKKIESYL